VNPFLGAARHVWDLFVEDATFTLGTILCLILAGYVLPHVPITPAWRGPLLFLMLAVILVENVVRSARQ
jgi:hypothetical protein